MNAEQVANILGNAKRAGSGWLTKCPAHDDKHASLTLSDKDGKLLWNCKTGCAQTSVLDALKRLGLLEKSISSAGVSKKKEKKEVIETHECSYNYTDEDGKLLFRVHRYKTNDPENPKTFKQQTADGAWKLGSTRRVLYNLKSVLKAKELGNTIYLVEGEKDADNLIARGFCATTNSSGGGTWSEAYTEVLTGANVILIPDNDRTGRDRVKHISKALLGKAASVKILSLDVPEKGDVSDWLQAGHTLIELLDLSKKAEVITSLPDEDVVRIKPEKKVSGTDLANTEKFIHYVGGNLKFNKSLGWCIWNEARWKMSDPLGVQELAKSVSSHLWRESEDVPEDQREEYKKWSKKTQSRSAIENMISLARSEVEIQLESFDKDPLLFNCENGTVNIETFEIKPYDRNDFITKKANVRFVSGTKCDKWLAFLDQIMAGNDDMVAFLQRAAGYTLSGSIQEQKLFFCFGSGQNGKSVFLTVLQDIFGDYARTIRAKAFMEKKNDSQLDSLSPMVGARFVRASEIAQTAKLDEALIKDITGGEMVPARLLYQEPFEFKSVSKLWLHGNHKPRISGSDFGIWRRMLLIPFEVTIPENERDHLLVEKLLKEREGIFQWALIGYQMWKAEGLNPPQIITAATKEYEIESDAIGEFLTEHTQRNEFAQTRSLDFYQAYAKWCEENGYRALSHKSLAMDLKRRGIVKDKKRIGIVYLGIQLLKEGESNEEEEKTG